MLASKAFILNVMSTYQAFLTIQKLILYMKFPVKEPIY